MAITEEEFEKALADGLGFVEWRQIYEKHFGEPVPFPLERSWGLQPVDMIVDAIDRNKKLKPVKDIGDY